MSGLFYELQYSERPTALVARLEYNISNIGEGASLWSGSLRGIHTTDQPDRSGLGKSFRFGLVTGEPHSLQVRSGFTHSALLLLRTQLMNPWSLPPPPAPPKSSFVLTCSVIHLLPANHPTSRILSKRRSNKHEHRNVCFGDPPYSVAAKRAPSPTCLA